jgi:hypothetical protein
MKPMLSFVIRLIKPLHGPGRGDRLIFVFYADDKEGSGWVVDRENPGPHELKEFGLSADEEKFFESRKKAGL